MHQLNIQYKPPRITERHSVAGILCIALLLCIALAPTTVQAAVPDPAGTIIALEGTASAVNADGVRRALTMQGPVFPLDRILTAADSKLQIMFVDDTLVSQGEKSELVIDEYVFDPDTASNNRARLGITKGLFRVITDKITRLNPKRFKVKTRMATIGIRGCDVGFKVLPDAEDIYIITLHGTEKVSVEGHAGGSGSSQGGAEILIDHSRKMVLLRKGKTLQVLDLPPNLLALFLNAVEVGEGILRLAFEDGTPFPDDLLTWLSGFIPKAGGTPPPGPPPPPELKEPDPPPPPPPPPKPKPKPRPKPEPEPEPQPLFTEVNRGTDWYWGYWSLEDEFLYYEFDGNPIDPDAFEALATGDQFYALTGNGDAAAAILNDGELIRLEGNCLFNVILGEGTPFWFGSFNMWNENEDALFFEAEGLIQLNGTLSGSLTESTYLLDVPGFSTTDLPGTEAINGNIAGDQDITGAFGTFLFTHPDDNIEIDGGFATPLNESLEMAQ